MIDKQGKKQLSAIEKQGEQLKEIKNEKKTASKQNRKERKIR